MKCTNCGTDFSGDICPNCQTPASEWTDEAPMPERQKQDENVTRPPTFSLPESEPRRPKKKIPMRLIAEIAGGILLIIFIVTTFVFKSNYDSLESDYSVLTKTIKENEANLAKLHEMENEYTNYKKRMKPFEALDEAEAKARQIKAEQAAADKKAADEKAAADKKAADEKAAADAAAAKAEEEARGYETGITYDQLARTPDSFKGQKVKFTGKVIQVLEDSGIIQIRLAVNDNYDTILLGTYSSKIVSSRILEDDHITIYGTSAGTITYKSTMGGSITIPGVTITKIDQ